MAQIGVFSGAVLASPDDKGRLALPAVLRNSIPGEGKSKQLYITTHEVAPCLVASGTDRIALIAARIERAEDIAAQRGDGFDRFALERRLYGPGETVPVDTSGRFILSDMLAEIAEIGGDLFFYGAGQYFEIWDVARLTTIEGDAYAMAQRALAAAIRLRDKKGGGA
jgi:MraZ protein